MFEGFEAWGQEEPTSTFLDCYWTKVIVLCVYEGKKIEFSISVYWLFKYWVAQLNQYVTFNIQFL